jgi:hypothetical protein
MPNDNYVVEPEEGKKYLMQMSGVFGQGAHPYEKIVKFIRYDNDSVVYHIFRKNGTEIVMDYYFKKNQSKFYEIPDYMNLEGGSRRRRSGISRRNKRSRSRRSRRHR